MITKVGPPPVIIHMGCVRNSTTMHHRYVLPRHENIYYLGKPFANAGIIEAFRNLACRDTSTFDEEKMLQRGSVQARQAEEAIAAQHHFDAFQSKLAKTHPNA